MRIFAVLALASVVSGCAGIGPMGGDYCALVQPTRLSKATIERLSDDEVTSILVANEVWKKRCT
jgi:hypothetical protein